MNYKDFKTKKNIDRKLLCHLGLFEVTSRIIQITNDPDYELSKYESPIEKTYYFRDSWSYEGKVGAVIDISIKCSAVFHYNDIVRLSKEYEVPFKENDGYDQFLDAVREKNNDVMLDEGWPTEFDGFRLNSLQVERIDHSKKVVHFIGSYDGDSSTIQPIDWSIIIECEFSEFALSEDFGKFYVDLVSEAYALRNSGNLKLSYFIFYTAFENYVNEKLNAHDEEGRLKEKLNRLFKSRFLSLEKHQIYSSIAGELDRWEKIRNEIAHGRSLKAITEDDIVGLSMFVITLIASCETEESEFDSLFNLLNSRPNHSLQQTILKGRR